jgi:signal transduction histidine kinase
MGPAERDPGGAGAVRSQATRSGLQGDVPDVQRVHPRVRGGAPARDLDLRAGTVKAITAELSLTTVVMLYPLIREQRLAQEALEEKTRALETAQEELVRQERLATLGQLAAGMSHELRNPLGVIRNSVYYLNMVLPEEQRIRKHLSILDREVSSATRIISGLLDFSRVRPPTQVLTELHLPLLAVDPDQVRLILGNLISNAIQAMPDGGVLAIEVVRADGGVAVVVVDTGDGIAGEHLEKIFEPLFTTKARGIGLGLDLVRRLAESNGASIAVESTPKQGSRFTVRFRDTQAIR